MKLLNLAALLSLFSFVGCASFQDKHNCHTNTFKLRGNNYRYCSLKDPEKPFFGVTYGKSEDWLFEPAYTLIETFNEKELYATKAGGGVVKFNFSTKKMEDTEYLSMDYANSRGGPGSRAIMYSRYKNGTDIALLKSSGEPFKNKISSVDYSVRAPGGGTIAPIYYVENKAGIHVRHEEGSRKYYKIYSTSGEPLSTEFPAEEIQIFQTFIGRIYQPIQRIDKEQDLYWLLFPDNKSYFKKPDDLKGMIIMSETHYRDDTLKDFPTYDEIGFVFNGENGKGDYVVIMNTTNTDTQINSLSDFKRIIQKARTYDRRYYDYSWSTGKIAGVRGKTLDQKYVILKKENNKYIHMTDDSRSKDEFSSADEAIADINRITLNVDKDAVIRIKAHLIDEAENRAMHAETARRVNADMKRERDAVAEGEAEAEAARKAEDARIWGSVSNQIKGAADKAKTKADCVRKNTQTKKDYLDKKQGWYTTGGCD